MNKSAKNVALLLIAIFIWGGVIYKYYWNKPAEIDTKKVYSNQNRANSGKTKSNLILNNYPDPFLKLITDQSKSGSKLNDPDFRMPIDSRRNIENISERVEKSFGSEVIWPSIIFKGLIKNQDSIAFLEVNKVTLKLHLFDTIDNIKVMHFNEDSIILRYSGKEKVFKKGNN